MDELHKQVIKLAYENPGEVREALLPMLREARADIRVLTKLQMLTTKWDAALERAVRDIINMDDGTTVGKTDQKHTAEVLHQMLKLQVKDLQKQMDGLKKQYKVAGLEREAAAEISLGEVSPKHLKFVKQFGQPTEAWEGAHGIIVMAKVAQAGMSPRWSKEALKKMTSSPLFRWVEGHRGGAAFGLTHT